MSAPSSHSHCHHHILPTCSSSCDTDTDTITPKSPTKRPALGSSSSWVDPDALPPATRETLEHPNASLVGGNAPLRAKQLALNVFASYGVGDAEAFGHAAGRKVRLVSIDVDVGGQSDRSGSGGDRRIINININDREGRGVPRPGPRGKVKENKGLDNSNGRSVSSATAVAEVIVDKTMVNGNGMMHGGCIAYLVDNCGSIPLVVLGVVRGRNGVGVTQALNLLFHAPAPLGSRLEIVSTSLALGGRSMTARCEIFNKSTGRLVASAFINKMEPKL